MTSALRAPDPEHLQALEMEVGEEAIIAKATTTTLFVHFVSTLPT